MPKPWIPAAAMFVLLFACPAYGKDPKGTIVVYWSHDPNTPRTTVYRATLRSSKIFAGIGVPVQFRTSYNGRPGIRPSLELSLSVQMRASPVASLDALASSHPYTANGEILVFYSRVLEFQESSRDVVLGYILTHEIAHVLEGVYRHSDTGIMKENWDREDIYKMHTAKLGFEPLDIELIRKGVEKRVDGAMKNLH
jgi:hypothetical protein